MNKFQILLMALFIASWIFQTLGAYKLKKLVQEIYPDISFSRIRPRRRTLKKIEIDKKNDKEIVRRLRTGRVFEIAGLLIFVVFLIVFFVGLGK
jgi:hypothetical protein